MKQRIFLFLLACALLAGLFGCTAKQQLHTPVNFYYPICPDDFGKTQSYISCEAREAYGHREDTAHLIRDYLSGPQSDTLLSPFPAGVTLISAEQTGNTLYLMLSEEFFTLSDMKLSVACASLAKTSMELTGTAAVQLCGAHHKPDSRCCITLDASRVLLIDESAAFVPTEPTS